MWRSSCRAIVWVVVLGGCFESPPTVGDIESSASGDSGSSSSGPPVTTVDPATSLPDLTGTTSGPDPTTGGEPTTIDPVTTAVDGSGTTGPDPCVDANSIVYLNFDGAVLTQGTVDNAPQNVTGEPVLAGSWPEYETDDRDEIFDVVVAHWADFSVCITMEQPRAPDYDMLVVQSMPYMDEENTLSLVGSDCGNMAPNNVNVLFLSESLALPTVTKAIAISKTVAAFYGLDAVMGPGDIMNEFVANTRNGAEFTNECLPHAPSHDCAPSPGCNPNEQNSFARLDAVLN